MLELILGVFIKLGELHRYFLEDHVILSQSTRLVRQQELDAAKLFRDCRVASDTAWNRVVVLNAVRVPHFGQIQVYSHRNRDDGAEKQDHAEVLEVPLPLKAVSYYDAKCDQAHDHEEHLRHPVNLQVKLAYLLSRTRDVHRHAGLQAGVDHHTEHVTWGSKHCVCPKSVLETEAFFVIVLQLASVDTFKVVNLVCRRLNDQVSWLVNQGSWWVGSLSLWDGFAELPVCLSIELVCLDEHCPHLLGGVEEDKICRHTLVLFYLNNHANFDVLRLDILKF